MISRCARTMLQTHRLWPRRGVHGPKRRSLHAVADSQRAYGCGRLRCATRRSHIAWTMVRARAMRSFVAASSWRLLSMSARDWLRRREISLDSRTASRVLHTPTRCETRARRYARGCVSSTSTALGSPDGPLIPRRTVARRAAADARRSAVGLPSHRSWLASPDHGRFQSAGARALRPARVLLSGRAAPRPGGQHSAILSRRISMTYRHSD